MVDDIIQGMSPISLQEMEGVKLMNRIDTKYITTLPMLERLLGMAADQFFVQEIDGVRNAAYYTCYFDTPDVRMFHDHQRGKKSRRKVRLRQYLDAGINPFLEIKDKNNKGRTRKKRVLLSDGETIQDHDSFVAKHSEFNINELSEKIENRFRRITLVNKEKTERITIDTSVEFHNFVSGRQIRLPNLVIIEWKRDGSIASSRLKPLLKSLRIQERSFSKYVVGMALTDSTLRANRMKPKLHVIEKLCV